MINDIEILLFGILLLVTKVANGWAPINVGEGNYPNKHHIFPCATKKTIIEWRGPLCVPTADGFDPDSEKNCVSSEGLESRCPEFNRAKCEWFVYTWNETSSGEPCSLPPLSFPVCKQSYKAIDGTRKRTWLEIFYVNQLGTLNSKNKSTDDIYSVVELSRNRLHKFHDYEQDDWPASVNDSNSVAGILWSTDDKLQKFRTDQPVGSYNIPSPLCPKLEDTNQSCSNDTVRLLKDYLNSGYKEKDAINIEDCEGKCLTTIIERGGLRKEYVCQVGVKTFVDKFAYYRIVFQIRNINDTLFARWYHLRLDGDDNKYPE